MKNLLVIVVLAGTCCAQTIETGRGVISGSWTEGVSVTSAMEDIALPNLTPMDGSPLQLPAGVNPLAYLGVGGPTHTIYIGDVAHGCPKAPGANGSTSQSYCTYASHNAGSGALDDLTALNAVMAAWDGTYWDVWVTHGSHFDGATPWIWPDYYGAAGWLVMHSDCRQGSECTGTNDYGYNPAGRQVCSHGGMDQATPPVPNMGWRNHGCTGATLGFPATSAAVPITAAAYPFSDTTNYNDLGNMWTVSTSSNGVIPGGGSVGSVIQMGAAHTDGSTNCYGGPCPNDGVNHIVVEDARIMPDATGYNIYPVDISAVEWTTNPNPAPLMHAFVNAAPHDIAFLEDYFTSDADDDGFGVNLVASQIRVNCARCAFNHDYFDGSKRDGSEGHVISTGPPGPVQYADNWVEGNSIGMWGGGGSTPPVADSNGNGMLTTNVERARNRITYNARWLPSPGGIQARGNTISSWSCAAGTLTLTLANSVGNASGGNIYNPVIYVTGPSGSGIASQWYTATGPLSGSSVSIPNTGCTTGSGTGGGATAAKIYGFEALTQNGQPITVTSAAALNAVACGGSAPCSPVHMNPEAKNRAEWKESQSVWTDGELLENSGVDGQEGQCWSFSIRSCSGVSKCISGQTQAINDFTVTNSICRHANEGMLHSGRSGNASYGCWSDASNSTNCTNSTLTSVACDSTYNNVIDFTYATRPTLMNAESGLTGTEVYIYGVGSDLAAVMPDGWYQTENINYAATIPVYLPAGATCTAGHAYSTQGTLVGKKNGDGDGVSPGMHHGVAQNLLIYDIGNHANWNGSGGVMSISNSSSGNNFSVNVTMGPATGTHCTSQGQAGGTISSGVACAYITAINACPAAIYPASSRTTPDCPLLLQAAVNDLMNVQCPNSPGFSTGAGVSASNGGGLPNSRGAYIVDLDTTNQQWFTYAPNPTSGVLPAAGTTATCPLEPPNGLGVPEDAGSSGAYNGQSYPKTMWYDHLTIAGENGAYIGGQSFETNLTFMNGILAIPGTGDTNPSQSCSSLRCGFAVPGSDNYTGPTAGSCTGDGSNTTGITNFGDTATLTLRGWAVSDRSLGDYPIWQNGMPICTQGSYAVNGNSTPPRASTPGTTVTCGGAACSASNYMPDSIGISGAMNTNNFPLNLTDWRQYALDPSSPYRAGGILGASDGLDNGAITTYIVNAMSRTQRPCLLASGCPTYYHDGPQYEWLTWTCTGTCNSFNVYEDGTLVVTTQTPYAQIYGLGVNTTHTWQVTSPNGTVGGLSSQMY